MSAADSVQRFRDFELDRAAHELRRRGRPVRLEGRAMTLLLLLLERPGELVTRAEIVARLWGTDAFIDVESGINTAVRKLRAVLHDSADNPKIVKTVQGKGYRFIAHLEPLSVAPPDRPSESAPERPARARSRRALRWTGLGIAALALAVVTLGTLAPRPASPPRVQVLPLSVHGGGPGAQAFADALSDKLTGVLHETGVQTTAPPWWMFSTLRPRRPDLVFGGAVSERAGVTVVRLFLEDARAADTLWTHEFRGQADQPDRLAGQVAAYAGDTIYTALEPQQRGLRLDAPTLALYIRGAEMFKYGPGLNPGGIRRAFEQATERAPDFALAHGQLALALVAESGAAPEPERDALERRGEQEARTAIRIDPASAGPAYGALGLIERRRAPDNLWAIERHTREGLAADPTFPFLNMRECQLLSGVGRFKAALSQCLRAVAMRPMALPIATTFGDHLLASGDYTDAARQIDRVAEIEPEEPFVRQGRVYLAAMAGSPHEAARLLSDARARAPYSGHEGIAALELFVTARATNSRADVERATRALAGAAAARQLPLRWAVPAMATLGQVDAALELLLHLPPQDYAGEDANFLTSAASAALRADERYWTVAVRAGLVRYWITTNTWPDFCSDPASHIDCEDAANRAARMVGVRQ